MNIRQELEYSAYSNTLSHLDSVESEGRGFMNAIKSNFSNQVDRDVISFCEGWDEMFHNIDEYKKGLFSIKSDIENIEMNFEHYKEYVENLDNDIKNGEKFTSKDIEQVRDDMETMLKTTPSLLKDTQTERERIINDLNEKFKPQEKKSRVRMKR